MAANERTVATIDRVVHCSLGRAIVSLWIWLGVAASPWPAPAASAIVRAELINESQPVPFSHTATIEKSRRGLVAAWVSGPAERTPEVAIWLSQYEGGGWTPPTEAAHGADATGQRYPVWNPVLFQPRRGPLLLFYKVGPAPSNWWAYVKTSEDGGRTWSAPHRLPEDVLGPIKNRPIELPDGTLLCPASTEDHGWHVHFERTSDLGRTWRRSEPPQEDAGWEAIQPTLLAHRDGRIQALCRTRQGRVAQAWSNDGGKSWTKFGATELPNPNSAIAGVTLSDGRHLLVFNDSTNARTPLRVALSTDGRRWHRALTLEDEAAEFSYPTVMQAADRLVHVVYTWKKQRIKHVVIDPGKLPRAFEASARGADSKVNPPGVVIDHSAASSRIYIGSPSLAVLTNGDYVASHDYFGPGSSYNRTAVFRSRDHGASWQKLSEITGQFWSGLFLHRGALYVLGTDGERARLGGYGSVVIRRSTDGGRTWTTPTDSNTGLLRRAGGEGDYHCAPVPVVAHQGRLWRAFEHRPAGSAFAWAPSFRALMLSARVDADLLETANWTFSREVAGDTNWLDGQFAGWLEGNAVVSRSGEMFNVLRVDTTGYPEKAALIRVSPDGHEATFDPQTGFVDFPGGAKKFTIRFDPASDLYWTLATMVPRKHQSQARPASVRNTLALMSSPNLTNWTVRTVLLYHPDATRHGFQYVDWLFEAEDIIAACRTAFDDPESGAHNAHDANYLTFHRFKNFRRLGAQDSVLPASEWR